MDFCVAVNGEVDAIVGSHEGSDLASEGFDCDLPELLGGETGLFADGVVVDWDACIAENLSDRQEGSGGGLGVPQACGCRARHG